MARSIHTTRRTFRDLLRQKYSSQADKVTALIKARKALGQKRRIKKYVSRERHQTEPPLAGTAIETIPLDVSDESPFVHHGASPTDIRAILAALPPAATEGIARIQLCLGKQYMEERAEEADSLRDPFTGRLSCGIFPGVFGGETFGTYTRLAGRISIYAYVYDPLHLPLPRSLCEFYLRLHALKTFVHEVAHHHDQVARIARGRWRSDRKNTFEWYAEQMEHEWTQTIVLPYLKQAYPNEAVALCKWVAHRGGLQVDLPFFAGDTRQTKRTGPENWVGTTFWAFEWWVEEVSKCKSLTESRLDFARQLHDAYAYTDCLGALDAILAVEPDLIGALRCKAEALVQLDRLDEALSISELILRLEPANCHALKIRGEVYKIKMDWLRLLKHCAEWQQLDKKLKRSFARTLHLHRAVAHCAMENTSAMEESVGEHLALLPLRNEEAERKSRALLLQRVFRMAGKPLPRT